MGYSSFRYSRLGRSNIFFTGLVKIYNRDMAGGPGDEAGAEAGGSSSAGVAGQDLKRPRARAHYSGLWIGEAKPGDGLEDEIAPNPIKSPPPLVASSPLALES